VVSSTVLSSRKKIDNFKFSENYLEKFQNFLYKKQELKKKLFEMIESL